MSPAAAITIKDLELMQLLIAFLVLLISTHSIGYLFSKLKMPRVVGEICGGLLLGPTGLQHFAPEVYQSIFAAFDREGILISTISWLGMIFLMFVSGSEVQRANEPGDSKLISTLVVSSLILPLGFGLLVPYFYDLTPYLGVAQNALALQLIVAITFAVTSIPVISKIFIDYDIIRTRFSGIVLTSATAADVFVWAILAVATGLVTNGSNVPNIVTTIALSISFFALMLTVVPKIFLSLAPTRWGKMLERSPTAVSLIICLGFTIIAGKLGINIVLGSFLSGLILGRLAEIQPQMEVAKQTIKQFSSAFFVPIYFGVVGLKLNLIGAFDLKFFVILLVSSTIIKVSSVLIATRIKGLSKLSSLNFAVAMNTRGGPCILIATVALSLGIINEVLFGILVSIAIATSIMAGTWFNYLLTRGLPLMGPSRWSQSRAAAKAVRQAKSAHNLASL